MTDIVLKNMRPMGGPLTDLAIVDGRFAETAAPGAKTVECGGRILIPGLVEAHTHLDQSLPGLPWYRNEVGPRPIDMITNEREVKVSLGLDPQDQSARQAIQSVAFGTTHIRSHVDVDTQHGLAGVEGAMATREKLAGIVDIEIVAFPQSGMITRPRTVELMDEALTMGVKVVGGLDPRADLDAIFALAETQGKPVDIHLHERDALGWFSMEVILARTRAHGMQGMVTVSHAVCLGAPDRAQVAALQEDLTEAGVHIVTTSPAATTLPAVRELAAAGILTGSGSEGIRDTRGPYGNGDMPERADFIGLRNNLRRDDEVELALDICTRGGAAIMKLDGYGLAPCPRPTPA